MRGPLGVDGPLEAHKGYWSIFKAKIENVPSRQQSNLKDLELSSRSKIEKNRIFSIALFDIGAVMY